MNLVKMNFEITLPERWLKKFVQLLDCMRWCGKVGASRTLGFYADGDGDFTFNYKINGEEIKQVQDWNKIDKTPIDQDSKLPIPFHTNRRINFFFDAG